MLLLFLMDVCSCTLVYVRFTCPSKASVMQFNLENDSVNDKYLKNPSFFFGGGGGQKRLLLQSCNIRQLLRFAALTTTFS